MARKHLDVLEEAELIYRRKAGRTNFVGLRTKTMRELQEWLGQFRTEWGSDLSSLENYMTFMTDQEPDDD
jgi:DNA-binding transcriptional ArsR family regulator